MRWSGRRTTASLNVTARLIHHSDRGPTREAVELATLQWWLGLALLRHRSTPEPVDKAPDSRSRLSFQDRYGELFLARPSRKPECSLSQCFKDEGA